MNIGDLYVTLGIKADLKTLKDFAKTVGELPLDAVAAVAALAGISFELGHMAQEALNTAVAFQTFGNETGLSWQELQRWQIVAEQANVSTQAVTSSITALQRNIAEIRLGRGNISPFQMLGINPNQDAFHVLEQVRQRIRGVDPAMATNIISQMGMSPEMMNVLRLSEKQFQEFTNHVHGMTERQEKDFLAAKLALTQWAQEFRYAMFGVVSDFTEAIEKSLEFKNILIGVAAVLGIAAIAVAPLTVAMGLLILVLDDLAVYFTGGKSITGHAIEGIKELAFNLNEMFKGVIPGLAAFERWLVVLGKVEDVLEKITKFSLSDTLLSGIAGGPVGALGTALAGLSQSSNTNNNATVNFHVQTQGQLDAPGWQSVAGYVKRAVEDAHLQLNN